MQNFGLIEQSIEPKDWVLGAVTGLPKRVWRPDGQWDGALPVLEVQKFPWGDSMDCVSRSFLNCLEAFQKNKGEEVNYSDRALAKASGTTKNGNTMRKVADTVRDFGIVKESLHPSEGTISWEDYYQILPSSIGSMASAFLSTYRVSYEIVFNYADVMCGALQYSPLQVAMYAYGPIKEGIYQPIDKSSNHCVMLYGYEYGKYWKIYDHYTNAFKRLAWDYNLSMLYRINIEKTMPSTNPLGLTNNTLCQLVEAPGGVGMYLDGAILTGPLEKVHFTWDMRNKTVDRDAHKRSMTKKDWDQYVKKPLP